MMYARALWHQDNIMHYVRACWELGMPTAALFAPADLYYARRRSLVRPL
jgi:hypothetical protein